MFLKKKLFVIFLVLLMISFLFVSLTTAESLTLEIGHVATSRSPDHLALLIDVLE